MSSPTILMLTADRVIDRRILLQAHSLTSDGWTVTILAPPGPEAEGCPAVVRVGAAGAGQGKRAAGMAQLLHRLASRDGACMSRLRGLVAHHLVNPEPLRRRLMLPAALERPADVIVAHDLPMLPTAALAARHHGARLVYDSHELYSEQEFSGRVRRSWANLERQYIGACDAVITINASIADELRRRYGLDRVEVVQNAERASPDPPRNDRRFHRAFGLAASVNVVLFQGGLSAHRHLEALVDAMGYVAAPTVHLVLLGDGPLRHRLGRRAQRSRARARIHFHPAVGQAELLTYTASADVGVIPYQATCLNNLYCTPNKLFEYIAAGIPIIATDLPELRRAVHDNAIGLVTNTSTPSGIAKAIDDLVGDAAKIAALRANAAAARGRLNWEVESKILIEVYRRLRR
jgi:glycosyltransferase involved in cell wall biosynthesis